MSERKTRRLNREGTIRPRSGGRPGFDGRLVWVDDDGVEQKVWASGMTRELVGEKLRQAREDIENGTQVRTGKKRVTVKQYAEEWIASTLEAAVVAGKLTREEAKARASNLRRFVLAARVDGPKRPTFGEKTLSSLTPRDVERLFVHLATTAAPKTHVKTCARDGCEGCRPAGYASRRRSYFALRTMLATAKRDGLVRRNVTHDVDAPPIGYDGEPPTSLEPEEVAAVLRATHDDPQTALFVVMMSTACRREDIVAMRWSQVDLDDAVWRIPGGKTKAARRDLPLPPSTVAALREHRRAQAERRLAAPVWGDPDVVFTNAHGRALRADYVTRYVKRKAKAVDVAATPHTFRHTAISTALDADGVSPSQVAEWAGHGSASVTLDIYGHGTRAGSRRLADRMEALVTAQSV